MSQNRPKIISLWPLSKNFFSQVIDLSEVFRRRRIRKNQVELGIA